MNENFKTIHGRDQSTTATAFKTAATSQSDVKAAISRMQILIRSATAEDGGVSISTESHDAPSDNTGHDCRVAM